MIRYTKRIPAARDVRSGGFTLVELLVVIGIIALLISMLLPALNKARESAKALACASNMRQAGLAIRMYQDDNKGFLPRAYEVTPAGTLVWQWQMLPYIKGIRPYERITCPSIDLEISGSSTLTFGLNVDLIAFDLSMFKRTDKLRNSSEIILVADSIGHTPGLPVLHPYYGYMLGPEQGPFVFYDVGMVDYRHNKTANVLYLDQHVVAERNVPKNDSNGEGHEHFWTGITR